MAFRAYDPCFGCATHTLPGQMPMILTIRKPDGEILDEVKRDQLLVISYLLFVIGFLASGWYLVDSRQQLFIFCYLFSALCSLLFALIYFFVFCFLLFVFCFLLSAFCSYLFFIFYFLLSSSLRPLCLKPIVLIYLLQSFSTIYQLLTTIFCSYLFFVRRQYHRKLTPLSYFAFHHYFPSVSFYKFFT